VHFDLVGPLLTVSGGCSYLFTMVYRSTMWAEVPQRRRVKLLSLLDGSAVLESPLQSHQTGECSLHQPFGASCFTLGISHRLTTAYHTQANRMVKRFHWQLKVALRARLVNHDWHSQLLWVLLGLRAARKEDCGLSSAEMVYGEPLMLPGQFLNTSPHLPDFLEQLRQSMERFVPPAVRPVMEAEPSKMEGDLHKASFMYIKRGATSSTLTPLYQGPYKVLTWLAKVFQVDAGGRKELTA
jgi:hypothetical protein